MNRFDLYARAVVGADDECWPWQRAKTKKGYGCVYFESRQRLAHRVSYQLSKGPIPAGLLVCHTCDNPPCINPAHLFLGDHGVNNRDARDKGRAAFGDRNGSRLHPEALCHGSDNPMAKLTDDTVRWARAWYALGFKQREIAVALGVVQTVAGDAISGRRWPHVQDPAPVAMRRRTA